MDTVLCNPRRNGIRTNSLDETVQRTNKPHKYAVYAELNSLIFPHLQERNILNYSKINQCATADAESSGAIQEMRVSTKKRLGATRQNVIRLDMKPCDGLGQMSVIQDTM